MKEKFLVYIPLNLAFTCTYMHLHIELLSGRDGVFGPGYIQVGGQVAGAVGSVPPVVAGGPGQCGAKGGQEVIESPGHYGIVVEGNVECNDADGKAYTWKRTGKTCLTRFQALSTLGQWVTFRTKFHLHIIKFLKQLAFYQVNVTISIIESWLSTKREWNR